MSRYIDADKLTDEMLKTIRSFNDHNEVYDGADALLTVKNQPTADVRENVRGEWILHIDDLFPAESTMECNQCHKHQPITIDDNFCPNCGADMRGEQDE